MTHPTRESWLVALADAMRPILASHELVVPVTLRVSCSWPIRGGMARNAGSRTIGQCFDPACSADHTSEVFVSPVLADPLRVADVLAHELVHAALPGAKHGPKFARAAKLIGLEGKPTATVAGPAFLEWCGPIVESLGPYPHAVVDALAARGRPQGTRMLKVTCGECGYVARTTRKWIEQAGAPLCPCNGEPMTV